MKFSIRWTIIIGFIVSVWGTYFITTPSSYLMTKGVLTRHMQDIMVNISDLTLEQAHNHLNKAQSAAHLAKQLLSSNVVSHDILGSSALEKYLFNQLLIYPHLSGIYVGGLNGNFFMVSRHAKYQPNGFRTKVIQNDDGYRSVDLTWRSPYYYQVASEQDPEDTYDPRTRPWFKKALKHQHVIWTDPYIFFTAQKPGVTIAGPSYDENDNFKGVVGVDIEISEISNFISKLRVGKTGKAFIIHRNGDVIAYHDPDKLIIKKDGASGLRLPAVNELDDALTQESFDSINWQKDENGQIILTEAILGKFTHQAKTYLSMFTPFPEEELPWIVGVYIPEDDYLAAIKNSQWTNVISTFFIMFVVSVFGLVLAKKIINPIVQLAEGSKAIENYDIQKPFHLKTVFKEIQETADSFFRMKVALLDFENKLSDQSKIYRAITTTASDSIVMINSDHEITYLNPAAERMFGLKRHEVIGKNFYELLVPDNQEDLYRTGMTMFMQRKSDIFEGKAVKATLLDQKHQEVPVELSLSRLEIDNTLYVVALIRNITDRVKAAELRKRLVNDLHDGVGGTLSNIKLLAEMTKAHTEFTSHTLKNLSAIAENSEDCITEIQNYINVLDNPEISWRDFIAELHRYCAKLFEPYEIDFIKDVTIDDDRHMPTTQLYMHLFKIVKEAINNVIKHSDGDKVSFETTIGKEMAQFIFKDNGLSQNSPTNGGRGIVSMKSRVDELGGTIDFSYNEGFCISIQIPFTRISVREKIIHEDKA